MSSEKDCLQAAQACNRDVPNTPPSAQQDCSDVIHASYRRKVFSKLLSLALFLPLTACDAQNKLEKKFMKNEVVMDVVLYSYLERPIFDIYFNHTDLGVANSYGGTGISVGVNIPFGSQTLRWILGGPRGMPRNGETVTAKNTITLTREQIPTDANYIGIHIYPDDTFELTFSKYLPDPTERGHKINEEAKHHVK